MCEKRYKTTPRDTELKKDLERRLNRVQGQLNGVSQMVENDRYCVDILMQISAVQSALQKVSDKILAEHMKTCMVENIEQGNLEIVDEMIGLVGKYK